MEQSTALKNFSKIEYIPSLQQNRLVSLKAFQTGNKICHFGYAEIHDKPSRYTVQIGDHKHIILNPAFLEFVNHSCEPNAFFNTQTFEFECLRPILPGDEFTFFYPSTEWDMEESFQCHCKTSSCKGHIRGAKYLSQEDLVHYKLTSFIELKLQGELHGLIIH